MLYNILIFIVKERTKAIQLKDGEAKNLVFELYVEKMEAVAAAAIAERDKVIAVGVANAERDKAIAQLEIQRLKNEIRALEVEMLHARGAMTSRSILERALLYAHKELSVNKTKAKLNESETIEKIGTMVEKNIIPESADVLTLYSIFKHCGINDSNIVGILYVL